MAEHEILVDARGHRCPVPTLRLRRALDQAPPGARVRLLADDPMARIDVPHFAAQIGATILEATHDDAVLSFLVRRDGTRPPVQGQFDLGGQGPTEKQGVHVPGQPDQKDHHGRH